VEENIEVDVDGQKQCFSFFGVFDGHGGKKAADFTRDHLCKTLVEELKSGTDAPSALRNAYVKTDDAYLSTDGDTSSGTTVATALLELSSNPARLWAANAGDARVVLCVNGKAHVLSYDHKASDQQEVQRIRNSGGKFEFECPSFC